MFVLIRGCVRRFSIEESCSGMGFLTRYYSRITGENLFNWMEVRKFSVKV